LDEFEKAHPKVQQLFLGIFDKGSVLDNHSGQIDMSDTTIILTSNAGVRSQNALGFGSDSSPAYVADKKLIQQSFAPELLGRLDAQILFKPLDDKALRKIVDKNMMSLRPKFDRLGVQVTLSKNAKSELLLEGKNPMYGARPILSLMRQKVKLPIEVGVLKKKIKKGNKVVVTSLQKDNLKVLPKQVKKLCLKPSKEL
jgi:ATP-dependent Clp protease ATP-binding subunit ClpA